jgi:hypothetical protein
LAIAAGAILFGAYIALPLSSDEDTFRRATIAERFFRPADRLSVFEQSALEQKDHATLRRITDSRWSIADTRAYAPDSFPYETERAVLPSPTALMKQAIEFQKSGEVQKAEAALRLGKNSFPFAACEFGTNLAVLYYTSNRKLDALAELESVQPMITPSSRPDCARSSQLLAELQREIK